jgi:hypothetical protein
MRLENREACDCASPPESPMDPGVSFGGFSRDFDRAAAAAPIMNFGKSLIGCEFASFRFP